MFYWERRSWKIYSFFANCFKFSSTKKVLLVSLDPAHNLSDIFNLNFSDKEKRSYSKSFCD
ncbi:MAG: hypothetical protein H6613_08710 [Ignavibacteriales bacterium]|nr:hypothetical protein [Ignavibacteriales bacterium]